MEKITAIIVDDEERARRVLKNLLEKSPYEINILALCGDVISAVEVIKTLQPQLVFLDVEMPNYAGYELVNFLDEINFEIIFVTAYNQYAIKAFELCAVDYLVKPIHRKRLDIALGKLVNSLDAKNKLDQYQTLLNTIKKKDYRKLIIPELNNRRIIDFDQIISIEADGAYTSIHLKGDKQITTSKNLKYYENALKEESLFFRSHRSWIVNMDCVKNFNKTESLLFLEENIEAKISRSQYECFDGLFRG